MLFCDYTLFFDIFLFVLIFSACKFIFKKNWLNNILILLGNALILTKIVSPRSVFILFMVSLIMYGAGIILRKRKFKWLLAIILTLLIVVFSVRNYPLVQSWFGEWWEKILQKHFFSVEKLGLSYIFFRMIHWLVECYRQNIRSINVLSYVNYLFFFPTFPAGPIDTFNNFHYWVNKTHLRFNLRMLLAGVGRIFVGAVKLLLIVPLIKEYAVDYNALLPYMGAWSAVGLAALLYSIYIYIDFSGYCDVAIGTAYMLGIRTPENFRLPYLSSNIAEFWKRWHMTFSSFLKMYVFKPVIELINRTPIVKYRMLVSVIAYWVTFFVCGLWHGSTLNFVFWGLWHGIGLSIYKVATNKNVGKSNGSLSKIMGVAVTFVFVTVGWIFFNYPVEQLVEMFNLLF